MLLLKLHDYYFDLIHDRSFNYEQLEFTNTVDPDVDYGLFDYTDTLLLPFTLPRDTEYISLDSHLWYLVYIFEYSGYHVYDAYNPLLRFSTLISINHTSTLPTKELTFFLLGPFTAIGSKFPLYAHEVQEHASLDLLSQFSLKTRVKSIYRLRLVVLSTTLTRYYHGFIFIQLPLLFFKYSIIISTGTRCPNCCICFEETICPICNSDLSSDSFRHRLYKYSKTPKSRTHVYYSDCILPYETHFYNSLCFQNLRDIYYINYNYDFITTLKLNP